MSEEKKKLSDHIIDAGDDFQLDALEDVNERIAAGEFAGKTEAEIRSIVLDEIIASEEEEEQNEAYRRINELEAREKSDDDNSFDDDEEDE